MFRTTIDTSDLERKFRSLTEPSLVQDIAKALADEAVAPELAKEPFRTKPYKKMVFQSKRQRAFVMAGIRKGSLQLPYRRTGKVGITEQVQTTAGIDVVVPAPYSDLVRTKGKQAEYHKGLWPTTDQISSDIQDGGPAELIGTAAAIVAIQKAGLA